MKPATTMDRNQHVRIRLVALLDGALVLSPGVGLWLWDQLRSRVPADAEGIVLVVPLVLGVVWGSTA
jgi:hypothetical protein